MDIGFYARRAVALGLTAALAAVCMTRLLEPDVASVTGALAATMPASASGSTPQSMLASLPVATEEPSGYDRELFRHWVDADGDGCDTRREVLLAEARRTPQVGADCRIDEGRWVSVYDGKSRVGYPADFDVDHLVPLAEAWASGAWKWSSERREKYANDLRHPQSLIAVTASTNRQKSDQDPAEWLPPSSKARCGYAADWVRVKSAWRLTIDPAEKRALSAILADCPAGSTLVRR